MSTNMRVRDRSVKIIQYGCQMIIGYYANYMSKTTNTSLSSMRRTASNARKAFWLLKWLNHIIEVKKLIEKKSLLLSDKFDTIQQSFWVLYFFYENQVFFARLKLFGFDENKIDYAVNFTWLCGDIACFAGDLTRLIDNYLKRINLNKQITEKVESNIPSIKYTSEFTKELSDNVDNALDDIRQELTALEKDVFPLQISFGIAIFELGVSLHYMGIYRLILGKDISEGHVGLMGVISSSLIIYEGYMKARIGSENTVRALKSSQTQREA
eukprot:CAMPEP_0196765466 /NCGR_PEP_ID=MMETSP1095-20130614/9050_1 /TAXON_ID=96789 ORGANISM="Chromulina nebulosa, Strain UTEXLB2642" /NCGR_SAMPLE_ID=MMETSP1095 /ASSEMBLY_ACC=CAM_ASM_000446 /LENGTH=268 /DNA_ID=CAMNT_0042123531 /DNA_START=204 /DNA_END=1010 /DNA_ORIENTATION=+